MAAQFSVPHLSFQSSVSSMEGFQISPRSVLLCRLWLPFPVLEEQACSGLPVSQSCSSAQARDLASLSCKRRWLGHIPEGEGVLRIKNS